ncbi:MAG: hypothetical protein IPK52_16690 [Chloroflexi bacterium]|nr:hypothetical protein [Chloroflexota bacterium]
MRRILSLTLVALTVSLGVSTALAQDAPPAVQPTWADLEPGVWTNIPGAEGTICATGTPYSFYVRPASQHSEKLLIHFQGGGACWMGQNCDRNARPTYDAFVDESDDPTGNLGIGDFDNPENPFTDYNMVFAPYCTGDVHLGSSVSTYPSADSEVEINHNGFDNATSVLAWTFENIPTASDVFVTGCSAGSIPSPFYVLPVAAAYQGARIVQLGDASGSYRNVTGILTELFRTWGTFGILDENFAGIEEDALTFESLYMVMGNLFPDVQFAQYNAAFDMVQTGFIILAGLGSPNTLEMLQANHDDIRAALDQENFHAFTAGGSTHCITVTPDMYTFAADGVRFVDWITALANGDPLDDVACTGDCRKVETIEP